MRLLALLTLPACSAVSSTPAPSAPHQDRVDGLWSGLLISEVMDHADGQLKYVEVCNRSDRPLPLGDLSLHRYSNGSTEPAILPLSDVTLGPGEAWVIGRSGYNPEFFARYGRAPDQSSVTPSGNGDDAYALFFDDELIDIYGAIGKDGTNTPWDYTDHVATRATTVQVGIRPWQAQEWSIDPSTAGSPGTCTAPVDDCGPDEDGDGACHDCDDTNPLIYPGAPELCDGLDNDCDGPEFGDEDSDADGLLDCEVCDAHGLWSVTTKHTGQGLRDAIEAAVEASCGWNTSRRFMFGELDAHHGEVDCIYTDASAPAAYQTTTGTLNTEHAWPQSLGASEWPARCDLHHLFPADAQANGRRSSHPFGVPTHHISWEVDGSRLGEDALNHTVFEPPDDMKGNLARALLYMSVEYRFELEPAYQAMLIQWSHADPVDTDELARTEVIAAEQGDVNPFVTCSFLVDAL